MELTRGEIRIMHILWTAKRPLTRKDIIELNSDTGWEVSALHSLLNSLLRKGAIVEAGISKSGRSIGRLYKENYSLQDYIVELLEPVDGLIDYKKLFILLIQKWE